MSAIACIYQSNKEPVSIEHINRMMGSLQQYPADDIQVWHKENVFLGCHAQWITPESIGEQLPYHDSERQIAITVDSIIDNRKELFNLLQIEPNRRKMMPDRQLILLAYCKWGQECPKYLIGDFAFIIWDERKQLVFGARDFSGSRTLYYSQHQEKVILCTTIKPMFSLPYIEKRLNEQWLAEYLAIPGMHETVEAFSTPYEGINQIPPAHSMSIKDGKVTFKQYINVQAGETLKLKSNEEYEEAFRDVFQSAVTDRTRTYRNVGAHLSGGLDSGSVVSFAARSLQSENKQLHTFSYVPIKGSKDWTPKNRAADETPFIQSTIQYVGNISENYMDFKGKSPLSEVDDWLDIYEMPYKFIENSYWVKGVYEQASKDNVGILLCGSRGNWTISWGSALDYQATLLRKMDIIGCHREVNQYSANIGIEKSRVMKVVRRKAFPLFFQTREKIDPNEYPTLINSQFAERMGVHERLKKNEMDLASFTSLNIYEARKQNFTKSTYWNINGTTGTKLSLRYKLWERDPTNDLRVIRFCLSVPENQFVQNGMDRSLVRRSTRGYLPDKIRLNQTIRGIQGTDGIKRMAPNWDIFINEVEEIANDTAVRGYLNIDNLRDSLAISRKIPNPDFIFDHNFKLMMRSLVVSRFLKNFN